MEVEEEVIERPPSRDRDRKVAPTEPKQPNGWRCEQCDRRSENRNALCHPVPA